MPDPDPETLQGIRGLAAMPDEFYKMYEAQGNILMLKAVRFARTWLAWKYPKQAVGPACMVM